MTASAARAWFPDAYLDGRPGIEYVASSGSGGTNGNPYDVAQKAGLTMVLEARSRSPRTALLPELLADHAVVLTARVVGTGKAADPTPSGSERAVTVRGVRGTLLAIQQDGKPGMRLISWTTVGAHDVRISWQALDRPADRTDEAVLALLNALDAA